jgi:predicted ATPase
VASTVKTHRKIYIPQNQSIFSEVEKEMVKISLNPSQSQSENPSPKLEINANLEFQKMALLIGPNNSGKTLILRCITQLQKTDEMKKYKIGMEELTPFVNNCEVNSDTEFKNIIYIDPLVMAFRVYYEYSYDDDCDNILRKTNDILYLINIREEILDTDINDALNKVNDELNKITKEAEESGHPEEVKHLIPTWVNVNEETIIWRDQYGNYYDDYKIAPMSIYPALVLNVLMYGYALSKREPTLLLIDNPEAFAYPPFSYSIGRIMARLATESDNLYIISATHSWEILIGAKRKTERTLNETKVYFVDREGNKITLKELSEGWYIPGLSLPGVLM